MILSVMKLFKYLKVIPPSLMRERAVTPHGTEAREGDTREYSERSPPSCAHCFGFFAGMSGAESVSESEG